MTKGMRASVLCGLLAFASVGALVGAGKIHVEAERVPEWTQAYQKGMTYDSAHFDTLRGLGAQPPFSGNVSMSKGDGWRVAVVFTMTLPNPSR
jgi:hypothetical protein